MKNMFQTVTWIMKWVLMICVYVCIMMEKLIPMKLGIPNRNIYTNDRDVIIETIPKKPKQNDNGLFVYGNNVFEGLSPVYSDADGYQYEIRSLNPMDSQDEKDKEAASSFIKRFKNIQ